MKKIAALFLALVMALSLATTAFATEVEINNPNYGEDGGTYKAYKLMNASVSGENFSYTENDKYTGVMKTALVLDATATFDDVLAKLGDEAWKGNAENVRQFADALYREIINGSLEHDKTWTGKTVSLDQGYWLIADVTDLPTQDTTYAKSLVMIDTAGDTTVEVNAKAGGVVTEKHLDDENDSLWNPTIGNEDGEDLWDIADYDIGDEVPYTITITLPDKIAEYSYYSFIIQDQVEEGLTYLEDSFQITVNNDVKTLAKVGSDGNADFLYEIVTTTDATTEKQTKQELYIYPNHGYTARDNNQAVTPGKEKGGDFLKLFSENTEHSVINNSKVVFTYKCLLNENAKVGNVGNPNEYSLKFSNNPYTDSFGETPKDVNLVLTYQVVFKKVNADQQPLAGADFDLYKFKPANVGDNPDKDAMADAGYVYSEAAESWGTYEKVESKSKNVPDIPETDVRLGCAGCSWL